MASSQPMPAMPPPDGQKSNFINPTYQGDKFLIVNCVFLPLAVIALVVRIWTRIFIVRNFRSDDYKLTVKGLMIMALVLSIVMTAVTLEMLNWGLGRHMWDVPAMPDLSPKFMKLNMLAAIFYCAATGFTKVSVLIFYLRIFPSKNFHIAVWTVVFIAVGYNIASVLANVFACTPIAKSWDLTIMNGACMNRSVFYFANAGLGIFTDFATVLVPIPWLAKLQMPLRQKVAIGVILAMGCFVGVVSCIRLSTLYTLMNSPDLTWATTDALMWCAIELNLGIVGGCVTAMRPFVRRYFPRLLGLSSSSDSYGHSGYGRGGGKLSYPLGSIPRSEPPNFTGSSHHQYSTRLEGGANSSDGDSEELGLKAAAAPPGKSAGSRIVRTVEFDVEDGTPPR